MTSYEDKIGRERKWFTQNTFQPRHFLNSRLFYSVERNAFNYTFPRRQLSRLIGDIVKSHALNDPRILIAPIGGGDDIPYVQPFSRRISGIDVSKEAVDRIADERIEKHVGDMKNMTMFPDRHFDVVVVSLFFHHYVEFGFDDFLLEVHRVLRPGGHFFSLEPSSLHPVTWVTRCLKEIAGNITGAVEDEAAFNPLRLSGAMRRCGFSGVKIYGATFSHNRLPIWIARVNNAATYPLLRLPIVKHFAWMCLFYGRR